MPANDPAAYSDPNSPYYDPQKAVATQFNANPNSVGGFQGLLDDLKNFLGGSIAQRPEGFTGPPSTMDFAPDIRARMARQALGGGNVDMSGVTHAQGALAGIADLLRKLRGASPDQSLADRLR